VVVLELTVVGGGLPGVVGRPALAGPALEEWVTEAGFATPPAAPSVTGVVGSPGGAAFIPLHEKLNTGAPGKGEGTPFDKTVSLAGTARLEGGVTTVISASETTTGAAEAEPSKPTEEA